MKIEIVTDLIWCSNHNMLLILKKIRCVTFFLKKMWVLCKVGDKKISCLHLHVMEEKNSPAELVIRKIKSCSQKKDKNWGKKRKNGAFEP